MSYLAAITKGVATANEVCIFLWYFGCELSAWLGRCTCSVAVRLPLCESACIRDRNAFTDRQFSILPLSELAVS